MYIKIGPSRSQRLPNCVDYALHSLLQNEQGAVLLDENTLQKLREKADRDRAGAQESNIDTLAEMDGFAIAADGDEILRAVLEGLDRRLKRPLHSGEKIHLHGEDAP